MASNLLVLFINLLVLELFIVKQYIRRLATKNWENGSLNWQLRARLVGETKDRTLQVYGVVLAKARSSNDLTLLEQISCLLCSIALVLYCFQCLSC